MLLRKTYWDNHFRFGKYFNRNIDEIYKENPKYVKWVATLDGFGTTCKENIEYCRKIIKESENNTEQ